PSHSAATTAPQETTGQSQTMEPDATEESTGPTASAPTASDPTWEPAPSGSATEPPEEASGSETEGSPETVAPTAPPETVAEQTGEISFPYAIADTGLVIQKIAAYDGVFLEDGTDEEITGVAAMVLENTGETAVEYTRISLNAGGETWSF